MTAPVCFICGGAAFDRVTPDYERCRACGHETLRATAPQAFIVNDTLTVDDARRVTRLDRFQAAVLDRFGHGRTRGLWVDIGSGSGRLLYHNRDKFARQCGVEITPRSVAFAREVLNVEVVARLGEVAGPIDFASAWHSFEHFPPAALETLLRELRGKMPAGAPLVVSVPNGASFQYRLFRRRFAFFDAPNHLQQFTFVSLERLLRAHGFRHQTTVVSWPYNAFGYIQSLLNLVVPEHNCLYYWLKRGRRPRSIVSPAASFSLLPLAGSLGLLLSLIDAVFPARQGVLTCCFEREG